MAECMRAVVITIPVDSDPEQEAHWVQFVGSQMADGFTSGHVDPEHYWSIEVTDA